MAKNITAAQRRRFEIITREVGCICCRMRFGKYVPAQANHLLNGYRIGHDDVTPECAWHHMGETMIGVDARTMRKQFGPSRKLNKKAFRKQFGSDEWLLWITNEHVRQFESNIIGGGKHENTAHVT